MAPSKTKSIVQAARPKPLPNQVSSCAPNPVSRPEAANPGDVSAAHRNLYCFEYSGCLNVAARRGWRDWSCEACALNLGARPPGAAQWAEARIRRD